MRHVNTLFDVWLPFGTTVVAEVIVPRMVRCAIVAGDRPDGRREKHQPDAIQRLRWERSPQARKPCVHHRARSPREARKPHDSRDMRSSCQRADYDRFTHFEHMHTTSATRLARGGRTRVGVLHIAHRCHASRTVVILPMKI